MIGTEVTQRFLYQEDKHFARHFTKAARSESSNLMGTETKAPTQMRTHALRRINAVEKHESTCALALSHYKRARLFIRTTISI